VELPKASVIASNPAPAVGEECWKTGMTMIVGEGTRSRDRVVARSLPEAVVVMWKVYRLWEILPIASWVSDYSENPVTQ
jgi:hypothetical protein